FALVVVEATQTGVGVLFDQTREVVQPLATQVNVHCDGTGKTGRAGEVDLGDVVPRQLLVGLLDQFPPQQHGSRSPTSTARATCVIRPEAKKRRERSEYRRDD